MDRVKIIEVKEAILGNNEAAADELRKELAERGLLYVNLMSSPGSGKTTTIVETLKALKDVRFGVMDADIDSDVDAAAAAEAGAQAIQLHTGGMCHLDADMSRQGMKEMGTDDLDIVILENVGNLVCPAEFDTGAHLNVALLSVPEGDDKPLKYPLIFKTCDAVLITKTDTAPIFNFDFEKAADRIHTLRSDSVIIPISAKTGEGMDRWTEYLREKLEELRQNG